MRGGAFELRTLEFLSENVTSLSNMAKHFEIVGNEYTENIERGRCYVNGKRKYSRILIKRKDI